MPAATPEAHSRLTDRTAVGRQRDVPAPEQDKAMDEYTSVSQLDDFEVIAERVRVTEAIAALTDRYRQLNQEMTRRETLRWMVR